MNYTITYRAKGNVLAMPTTKSQAKNFSNFSDALCDGRLDNSMTWYSIQCDETKEIFYLAEIRNGIELPVNR